MILFGWTWANVGRSAVPPEVEVHSSHQTTLDLDLHIRLAGRTFEREIDRYHLQKSMHRSRVDGFEVSWSENRHQVREPGYAHDRVLPVVGGTYRSASSGISRLDGRPITAEEQDIVRQVQLFDQIATIRAMIPERPGETTVAGPMFAGILADAPGTARVESGSLTWTREHEGNVHLAVALHLVAEGTDERDAHVVTHVRARGELVVESATGWTRRFDLQGEVEVTATRADLRTTGSGRFESHTTLDYHR